MRKLMLFLTAAALLSVGSTANAEIFEISICELQQPDEAGDSSLWIGDTVRTRGVVTAGTGLYYAGGGETFYMQDTDCGPEFAGVMAYDPTGAQFPELFPGDSVEVVAVVSEYLWPPDEPGYDPVSHTELFIVPEGFTYFPGIHPEPEPLLVPDCVLDSTGGQDENSEGYESVLCTKYGLTVDTVYEWSSVCSWECYDSSGCMFMVREASDSIEGVFSPPIGTVLNHVTGVVYHRFGYFQLQPRYMRDIEFASGAPIISQTRSWPPYPMVDDTVEITTRIFDPDEGGGIDEATIFYRINPIGEFVDWPLEWESEDRYYYVFEPGAFEDGDELNYYIYASDVDGESAYDPQQAPISYKQVFIKQPDTVSIGEAIVDNEEPYYEPDRLHDAVTVTGIVTANTFGSDFTNIYIQDETAGINVYYGETFLTTPVGNSLTVTGIVDHYNGKNQIIVYHERKIEDNGPGTMPDTLELFCTDLADSIGEQYEGLFAVVKNVTLIPEPDPWPELGFSANMTIEDGDGNRAAIRIDRNTDIDGQNEPSSPLNITGIIGQYDEEAPFDSNYQLMPRQYSDFVEVETGITEKDDNLPDCFALGGNYPNPFNPTTSIKFAAPHSGVVKIDIYDLMGRRVKKLLNENIAAGHHEIFWDGRNDNGDEVASGIYFYRMRADDFSAVKKMTVLK